MAKKGKKGTPPDLDFAFERDLIDESDYRTFWPRYWKANKRGKEKIIEELKAKSKPTERRPPEPTKGKITKSLRVATKEAKKIGGYIVRRDRFGRFNSRGRTFQAVTNKPKGKRK